jgi:group I intron endonuclease
MLAEENPDNNSLAYAWGCMAFPSNQYEQRSQVSPEEYEECRKMLAARSPSDETRRNMSVAQRKRLQTPEDNPFFGKHHTEETKTIIRNKAKERFKHPEDNPFYGKHHSEETKEKIRKAVEGTRSGAKNPRSKPVYSPELDEAFWGAKEAEIKYGIHHQHIAKCCRGTRKSAGKHPITGEKLTWKYITTELEEC